MWQRNKEKKRGEKKRKNTNNSCKNENEKCENDHNSNKLVIFLCERKTKNKHDCLSIDTGFILIIVVVVVGYIECILLMLLSLQDPLANCHLTNGNRWMDLSLIDWINEMHAG